MNPLIKRSFRGNPVLSLRMEWSFEHGMTVRRFGRGPEVVWIHGLGEQSQSFDPVAARVAGVSHVMPDLPGYGRSPWPAAPRSLDEVADDLAAWIGDRRPALVGHSLGGVLAQLVAERIAVRAVIDIDGNLSPGDCTSSRDAAAYGADDFARHGFQTILDGIYERGRTERPLRGYFAALVATSPAVFHRHAIELVALCDGHTLAPRLAALRVPVLFVAGGLPGGICTESRRLLDHHGIHWVSLEPSGHWVHLDQLERFAAEIAPLIT